MHIAYACMVVESKLSCSIRRVRLLTTTYDRGYTRWVMGQAGRQRTILSFIPVCSVYYSYPPKWGMLVGVQTKQTDPESCICILVWSCL
jgi:hypothetical protein